MKTLPCLILCILFSIYESADCTKLDCTYIIGAFSHSLLEGTYYCRVNNANINSRNEAVVDGITGTHKSGYNNDNVVAFQIYTGSAVYPPQGIEKYFKNLKAIRYQHCKLKEIHQQDLKPFPKLMDLMLYGNQIEVLEEGLFDFNPDLVYINIRDNKIVHIHSKVFDNLKKVTHIYLNSNTCTNKYATSPSQIQELIQQISSKCQNTEFLNLESKLKNLENSIKSLNSQTFKNQLAGIEVEIKNSKYAEHFTRQIEALKVTKIKEPTTTTTTQKPTTELTTTTSKPCICDISNQTTCTKVSDLKPILDEIMDLRASGLEFQDEQKSFQNVTFLNFEDKIQFIEDSLGSFQASTAKRLQRIKDDQKLSEFRLSKKIDSVARKFDALEGKLEENMFELKKILEALNNKV